MGKKARKLRSPKFASKFSALRAIRAKALGLLGVEEEAPQKAAKPETEKVEKVVSKTAPAAEEKVSAPSPEKAEAAPAKAAVPKKKVAPKRKNKSDDA